MPPQPPLADRTISRSPAVTLAGLLLVVSVLGLIVVGARTAAGLLRGLDQSAVDRISHESAPPGRSQTP